jgi:hypothetical protein
VDPYGRTVVAGDFTSIGGPDHLGSPKYDLLRLHADDTLDDGFLPPPFDASPSRVRIDGGGKSWIGGGFSSIGSIARNRIARLAQDGSVDPTFDPGAGPDGPVTSIELEVDGGATIGGGFTSVAGQSRNQIARLQSNGSLAGDFAAVSVGFTSFVKRDAARKLIVGGSFPLFFNRPYLARLGTDDSLDQAFAPAPDSLVSDALPLSDGRVIARGAFSSIGGAKRYRIATLLNDGSVDQTYPSLLDESSTADHFVSDSNGGLILFGKLSGIVPNRVLSVARLSAQGILDARFDAGSGPDGPVMGAVISPTRILIGGAFAMFNGVRRVGLARLRMTSELNVPIAPVPLKITNSSPAGISLEWSDVAAEAGYVIERNLSGSADWQIIGTTLASAVAFVDSNLPVSGSWSYRVRSYNAAGFSTSSNMILAPLQTTFTQWCNDWGLDPVVAASADLDGDGLSILSEYAHGLSPVHGDAPVLIQEIVGGLLRLSYFRARPELTYIVETSSDLVTWSTAGVDQGGSGPWVTAAVSVGGSDRKFLRLVISGQ